MKHMFFGKIMNLFVIFIAILMIYPVSSKIISSDSKKETYEVQISATELKILIDVFCVSITNIGDEIANNVVINTKLNGEMLIIGKKGNSDIIRVLQQDETHIECINPGFMFGLGEIKLSVTVKADNAPEVENSKKIGKLIGTLFFSYNDEIIDVTTDREEYGIGEPVTIIVTNVGETKIGISGPCFYFYNHQDELVWEGCLYCYWELKPGDYETIIWNQNNMQGEQVPSGIYRVKGEFNINNEMYSDTSTFYIVESGRFCGYVYGPDGQIPIEKARILIDAVDCFWETDENGYYETANHWTPGWWDLTACPPHEHPIELMNSFKIAHIEKSETCWINFTLENRKENNAPQNINIDGQTKCKKGVEYEYIFTADDPENDQFYFSVYWDDGNLASFYEADEEGKANIKWTWEDLGNYKISVYAIDKYAYNSELATLNISVSKSRIYV